MAMASLPAYDGRDPNTTTDRRCANCFKREGEPVVDDQDNEKEEPTTPTPTPTPTPSTTNTTIRLRICSRCQCLHYCSQTCQKENFADHKKQCKAISKATKLMEEEADKLKSCSDFGFSFGPPENLFETQVGRFWGLFDTRDYMRARCDLANLLYEIAYENETKELWDQVLFHSLEMLRLCTSDNLGIRYRIPCILLYLNRDDDAYSFCRYWETQSYSTDEDEEVREALHQSSHEGQWIYPKSKGCRYRDFFQDCAAVPDATTPKYISLSFLVAICIIKMRIVAAYDDHKKRGLAWDGHASTTVIESNRKQVQQLLDQIHQNNPSILPAIINPMPLKSQEPPSYHSTGHPSEVVHVLNDYNRAFVRVPGAEKMLQERFGHRPTYNWNLSL